jgi:hypothetical protein
LTVSCTILKVAPIDSSSKMHKSEYLVDPKSVLGAFMDDLESKKKNHGLISYGALFG